MANLTHKPLSWFKTAPQARQHFDEAELRRLGESLKIKQLQPVVAGSDGQLRLGERRLRAAVLSGLKELAVIISDEPISESQIKSDQLTENLHRVGLSDAEQWRGFEELLVLNPGWSNKDLAEHLKLSEGSVTKYLSPSRCTKDVQDALEAGRIGITTAYELSRVSPDEQAELLQLKVSGASRDAVRERVRKHKQSSTPQVRARRIAFPLPSGVKVAVSGEELSLDDFIDALGEAQKEAKKARDQSLDAKTFAAVMRDKAKKP